MVAATDISPDEAYYSKYYKDDYYTSIQLFGIMKNICKYMKKQVFKNRLQLIRAYAPRAEKILEIGCGMGDFLRFLNASYKCSGIEINSKACEYIRMNYPDIAVFDKRIDNDSFKADELAKYECIVMWHVLEHIEHPRIFIENLTKMLVNDGVVIFSIPNRNSIGFRLTKKWWFHLDAPRHLFHYNYDAIKKLFDQNVWEIELTKASKLEYLQDLGRSVYESLKTNISLWDKIIFVFIVPIFTVIRLLVSCVSPLNAEISTYVIRKTSN